MKGSRRLLEQTTDERAGVVREALDSAAEQAIRAGQSFGACAISSREAKANSASKAWRSLWKRQAPWRLSVQEIKAFTCDIS